MKISTVVLLFLALLPAIGLTSDGPVVATLSLPHAAILPGVPFDINVALENVSSKPARVGLVASLVITNEDGTEVRPHWEVLLEPNSITVPEAWIELAPGEVVQRGLSWSRSNMPNWASDPRYSGPGTYEVALELRPGGRSEGEPPLRTSSARLVRGVDRPEDAVVWKRMMEVSGGVWPDSGFISVKGGHEVAEEILTSHPSSGYYPYALLLNPGVRRPPVETSLEVAERFPDSPAHAHLLLQAADTAFSEAGKAYLRRDRPAATMLYERAAALYGEANGAKSFVVSASAAQRRRISATAAKPSEERRDR